MSNEGTVPNQAEKMNPEGDPATLKPEILDKIKHPPSMDDTLRQQSPEELMSNPSLVPEMLQEGEDLRDDLKRD